MLCAVCVGREEKTYFVADCLLVPSGVYNQKFTVGQILKTFKICSEN